MTIDEYLEAGELPEGVSIFDLTLPDGKRLGDAKRSDLERYAKSSRALANMFQELADEI